VTGVPDEQPRGPVVRARGWGLVLASHPGPAVVVTGAVTALTAAAGGTAGDCARVALVVLLGQLSVGWCNDAVDAPADAAAGRVEKPTVRGLVDSSLLWRMALAALVAALVLSPLLLGPVGGLAHVAAVLAAWAYDLRLKDTVWSPVPYAVAFGLVPVVAAGTTLGHVPQGWTVVAAAALGVGAHLANTAPDVASDRHVGRGGLAVRLGAGWARAAAVTTFTAGSAVVLVMVPAPVPVTVLLGLGQLGLLAVAAAGHAGRWLFPAVLLVVGLDAALLIVTGATWT
jgi:4-hydroxybenzoate polyprenyltransferase